MNLVLSEEDRQEILQKMVDKEFECRLYNGTEVIKKFGLTRANLKHIRPTWLDNITTPRYSGIEIMKYIKRKTKII